MPKTTITFDQAGGMKVDATGYKGKACAQMTEKLIGNLKAKTMTETKKPEYDQTVVNTGPAHIPAKGWG